MASTSNAKIAKRLGSVIKLRPEMYEKYKELHAAVWPQVISHFCSRKINGFSIS